MTAPYSTASLKVNEVFTLQAYIQSKIFNEATIAVISIFDTSSGRLLLG